MKILTSFALLFCFAAFVSAQERVIGKGEFDTLMAEGNSHKLKWKGEKYRWTLATSSKMMGRPQTDYSSKRITEYGPSMETRSILTSTFGGKPSGPQETLRIGNWVYTRSGNDAWVRKEYSPSTTGDGKAESEPSSEKVLSSHEEYKYLRQEKFRDSMAKVYVKSVRRKSLDERTGETSESESRNTYWIDAKGMILKSDYRGEIRRKTTHETTIVMDWQLDPSITFTAPDIAP